MWVTSEPLHAEQASSPQRAVPDLDDRLGHGQIEILDYSQWYTLAGNFASDDVLQAWVDN